MKKVKNALLILILIVISALIIFSPRLITVRRIECHDQAGDCCGHLAEYFEEVKGKKLYEARKNLKDRLVKEPLVQTFSLQFKLPDVLRIDLVAEEPKYAVKAVGSNYAVIGRNGKIVSLNESVKLPVLLVENGEDRIYRPGEVIDSRELFALRILADLHRLYSLNQGIYKTDAVEFKINDGPMVIFPVEGDRQVLIGALRMIMRELTGGEKKSEIEKAYNMITIDLRYKNPVLR